MIIYKVLFTVQITKASLFAPPLFKVPRGEAHKNCREYWKLYSMSHLTRESLGKAEVEISLPSGI